MKATFHLHDTVCECEISYPHQAPPVQVPGPGGVLHLQPSPYGRFDVKLETGRTTVAPGSYTLRCSLGELKVKIEKTEGDIAWGVRRVRES